MNKKLIALALAALPVAAMADVTIYGTLKGGFENVKDTHTDGTAVTLNRVADLGSRIGFKGTEDLGNGLKAIWQVENGFRLDGQAGSGSSSGTFGNRSTFIGLTGNFGTVRLGNLSSYGDSDMGIINTYDSEANALQLNNFTALQTRYKNSVRYDSPVFAGFDFSYLHSFGESTNNDVAHGGSGNGISHDVDNLGLGYTNGPVTAKYEVYRQKDAADTANWFHRIEATYTLGNWLLGAGYANNSLKSAAGDTLRSQDAALTVNYTIGAFTPKFTYDHGWNAKIDGNTIADTKYNQYIVGVDYALSKRTKAGLSFGEINTKDSNAYCTGGIGAFTTANSLFSTACSKERAVGLQLLHSF